MTEEFKGMLGDSRDQIVMEIKEISEFMVHLDAASEDYQKLCCRQKDLLQILNQMDQELSKLYEAEHAEERRVAEIARQEADKKAQRKNELWKVGIGGICSVFGIGIVVASESFGVILRSKAIPFIPKPKV